MSSILTEGGSFFEDDALRHNEPFLYRKNVDRLMEDVWKLYCWVWALTTNLFQGCPNYTLSPAFLKVELLTLTNVMDTVIDEL